MRNNLVIVTHPDDEILNMGGTLYQRKDEFWKIVCVTKDTEHGRDPQFREVCKLINADSAILGYEMGMKTTWDNNAVREDLTKILGERNWDRVFTHNEVGEYGHFQHKQVNAMMKTLVVPNLFVFGHGLEDANWAVQLTPVDRLFKLLGARVYARKTMQILAYDFFHTDTEIFREEI